MAKKTSTKKVGKASSRRNGVNGQKSRPTGVKAKAKRQSPTAEELTFIAWQYTYENRHRRLQ